MMTPTDRLDSIDARLERLVLFSEQQAASIERIAEASEAQRQDVENLLRELIEELRLGRGGQP
jgi:methyl-accepting chemotaxis protein